MLGVGFLQVLEAVKKLNSELIIVSGRSVTWGYFFLTHFPLNTAILEGGGVILWKDEKGLIQHDILVDEKTRNELNFAFDSLITYLPEVKIAADTQGRITDRALEYYHLSEGEKERLVSFLKKSKLNHTISSVHLNCWLGEISKFKAVDYYLNNHRRGFKKEDCLYFGDAPNDESMFQFFPNSVGVSNLRQYLHVLKHPPRTILEGDHHAYVDGVLSYLKGLNS